MNSEENFSHLVLVRHGQSEWNAKNLFTGWKNPGLTKKGLEEAKITGEKIKEQNIIFDIHFTSELKRALLSSEVKWISKIMFCSFIFSPVIFASSKPFLVRPGFFQPVKRFFAFHSLCPCLTRTK